MAITVELKGVLEERLELLVKAGLYTSKIEVILDGLRHLLKELDMKEIAFKLYKEHQISTGLALELAEMDLATFLDQCNQRGIRSNIGVESIGELDSEIKGLTDD